MTQDVIKTYEAIITNMAKLLEVQQSRESVVIDMISAAVAVEREACAKVCDVIAQKMDDEGEGPTGNIGWVIDCAEAIRARGQA